MARQTNAVEKIRASLNAMRDGHGVYKECLVIALIKDSEILMSSEEGPSPAPWLAKHVRRDGKVWSIAHGPNTFVITTAINECRGAVKQAVNEFDRGLPISRDQLISRMKQGLQRSVRDQSGRFHKKYEIENSKLVFRENAICTDSFAQVFLDRVPDIHRCLKNPKSPRKSKATPRKPKKTIAPSAKIRPIMTRTQHLKNTKLSSKVIQKATKSSPSPATKRPLKTCPHCGDPVGKRKYQRHIDVKCSKLHRSVGNQPKKRALSKEKTASTDTTTNNSFTCEICGCDIHTRTGTCRPCHGRRNFREQRDRKRRTVTENDSPFGEMDDEPNSDYHGETHRDDI